METLINTYRSRLEQIDNKFVRYLMPQINWNNRLFAIIGSRGTGKTTLMLQYIKQNLDMSKTFYMSLDELYFSTNRLLYTVDKLYKEGITHFFIDEIHKYPYNTWAQELKNIYDSYPDVKVVFSGSSILNIYRGNADLSRRALNYELFGLSFREFLEFEGIKKIAPVSLDDLLKNHISIASEIIRDIKILPLFRNYLKIGYFPYYKEDTFDYRSRLLNTVNATLETDLPAVENIEFVSVIKLKRLLAVIAGLTPFTPNMSQLAGMVEIQRSNLLKSLEMLERARMLGLLRNANKKLQYLSKPEKIFLDNPNLAYSLGGNNPNIGNLRETFFFNQLRIVGKIESAAQGDFTVDGKYIFEVGGNGKKFTQIAGLPDSYLAIDEIEMGFGNKIPLWLFGLLY
ncbi:MAG: AAA family ATPase [Prevotellaceae bacterium]|jgi:predicted AAA+ superfamily ATPase|nr:AAA family ATPase [Prevotellaceae bacterium]